MSNEASVTLHWLNGSRAQRILWLLTELKVPYDLKVYHRMKNSMAPPELAKVHPLGKSPTITVNPPAGSGVDPIVIAESGLIVEYLMEHWGRDSTLIPKKWKEGKEGQIGGETEAWLRYQYLLYFAEGSLMPYLVVSFVTAKLSTPEVPWFIRPLATSIGQKINGNFVMPNMRKNLRLIESFLANPPTPADGTGYLCGGHLTAADILLSYPLLAARLRGEHLGPWEGGSIQTEFPHTFEYLNKLEKSPGYLTTVKKIEETDGKFSLLPETSM